MTFLIEYDRTKGAIAKFESFADEDRSIAEARRFEIELDLRRQGKIDTEVVLLQAESVDAVRRTHRRYFESIQQFVTSSISSPILSKK